MILFRYIVSYFRIWFSPNPNLTACASLMDGCTACPGPLGGFIKGFQNQTEAREWTKKNPKKAINVSL